jgi:ribosomal protein S18 acetylase RimI-like enzyme
MKGIKGQVIQASMREAPATPAKPVARAAQPAKAPTAAAGFWSRALRPEMMPGAGRGAAAVQAKAGGDLWAKAPRPEMMPRRKEGGGAMQAKAAPRSGGASVQLSPVALAPAALRGGAGLPLPSDVRRRMEGLLGADLSAVRVHQGPQADAIGARAFTAGNDVYFGRQEYRPSTREGQALLAKQLTYVVQQRAGLVRGPGGGGGVVLVRDAGLEAQAEQIAALATRPGAVQAKRLPSGKGMFQVKTSRKGPGEQHLELFEGGRAVGGADVLLEKGQARLYNLRVDDEHRGRGGGDELLRAAADASARVGRRTLELDAQDDGSGKLVEWYEQQGFRRTGVGRKGMPALEAEVGRLKRR